MAERKDATAISRRKLLGIGAGAAGLLFLPSCGRGGGSGNGTLTFQTFGTPEAEKAFQATIDKYMAKNPDVTVKLDLVPFPQHYQTLDTRLAAGEGPDLVRIQYQQMGHYSSQGALQDLSEYFPDNYADQYLPNYWEAIVHEGKPYGVPIDTGSHGIFYNADLFKELRIQPPKTMDEAWSWEEFVAVAKKVKKSGRVKSSFAVSWQPADNAYRWTSFLYQHGGRLLNDGLSASRMNSREIEETIAFTQSWFEDGLVPASTSIKSGTEIQTLFANGNIGMMINGDFQMPFLKDSMKANWDVTYLTQDVAPGNALGGNGVGVTKDCDEPELAADFLMFLNNEEWQLRNILATQLLPTRKGLSGKSAKELGYEYRPELKDLFIEQLSVVSRAAVGETTGPDFGELNQALGDELEAAFKTGQSASETADKLHQKVSTILK
ncbi:MAG: extracellular solute-binding protein [Streptosporangiales bacterium]|nr:extracellular solute-binding protein [Streptosporangiales bacterium]